MDNLDKVNEKEFLTEQEAKKFKKIFGQFLRDYKEKSPEQSDQEWLEKKFQMELPDIKPEDARETAEQIVQGIYEFDKNLRSVNQAAENGISKERWAANKLEEACTGMKVNEFGQSLQKLDDALYAKNLELAEAMERSVDGHIKMSPNLDGNIAEHMIAKTTELSGVLQGKNIKVEVRDVFTPDSVDVRAINLDTGKYQNYQLKFGKDAKATIDLIERGNYDNQRIVVPKEQLEEVQAHFKAKGSSKTISDHIDAWGAKGKSFTKQEMKDLQRTAQEEGITPSLDYNHFQTKDLAMSVGKNAGVMALQNAAVITGLNVASKVFKGERIDGEELLENAIKTGADTSAKVAAAGALEVAVRKGVFRFIAKSTPAAVIANVACVGIENAKILFRVATGELSLTQGINQMGRVSVSMAGGLFAMAKGMALGAAAAAWIPVLGAPLAVITGLVGGMAGYFAGSKVGDMIYSAGKKVAGVAKKVAKGAWNSIKRGARKLGSAIKRGASKVFKRH